MVPPIASPKRIARSTAPLFNTGSDPGKATSTTLACVFGAAPNAVEAPEKILDRVDNCVCVSNPITTSQFMDQVTREGLRVTYGPAARKANAGRLVTCHLSL